MALTLPKVALPDPLPKAEADAVANIAKQQLDGQRSAARPFAYIVAAGVDAIGKSSAVSAAAERKPAITDNLATKLGASQEADALKGAAKTEQKGQQI